MSSVQSAFCKSLKVKMSGAARIFAEIPTALVYLPLIVNSSIDSPAMRKFLDDIVVVFYPEYGNIRKKTEFKE